MVELHIGPAELRLQPAFVVYSLEAGSSNFQISSQNFTIQTPRWKMDFQLRMLEQVKLSKIVKSGTVVYL